MRTLFGKNVALFLLLCSTGMQSSEYSKRLTNQFVDAVEDRRPEDALRMLSDPAIVSQIDVNAGSSCGDTPLICACCHGRQEIVKKLLELKKTDGSLLVDVNAGSSCGGDTPLLNACCHGHQGIVEKLLELKKPDGSLLVDVNASTQFGDTALTAACAWGHQGIVKKLLELKNQDESLLVDVNAGNSRGDTALMSACSKGNLGIVETLLELKKPDGSLLVDVNASSSYKGYDTSLKAAFENGYLRIVKTLLIHGADITIKRSPATIPHHLNCLQTLFIKPSVLERLQGLPESSEQKSILSVFDALKPGIKEAKKTDLEKFVVFEYEEFLQGNHDGLRNLLLVLPDTMKKRMNGDDAFINFIPGAMLNVFKKESITPLLYFLAEKQYQRDAAKYLVSLIKPALNDDSQVDHREIVGVGQDVVQSANRLSIEDSSFAQKNA